MESMKEMIAETFDVDASSVREPVTLEFCLTLSNSSTNQIAIAYQSADEVGALIIDADAALSLARALVETNKQVKGGWRVEEC